MKIRFFGTHCSTWQIKKKSIYRINLTVRFESVLVADLAFSDFSDDYLELPASNYTLDIKPAGSTQAVASFSAPVQTLNLQGQAVVVIASGFLNPAKNSHGSAFGV